jgi:hypothetical protein
MLDITYNVFSPRNIQIICNSRNVDVLERADVGASSSSMSPAYYQLVVDIGYIPSALVCSQPSQETYEDQVLWKRVPLKMEQ